MDTRISSKVIERFHELSWSHLPPRVTVTRRKRRPLQRIVWLGRDLLIDPRTGFIQAL